MVWLRRRRRPSTAALVNVRVLKNFQHSIRPAVLEEVAAAAAAVAGAVDVVGFGIVVEAADDAGTAERQREGNYKVT